ncbi:MAG: hypothetical protein S4CHLAM102_09070 [Chlamydiia bacterium]|nr:hypothetical protein [Chlamydiia bacterium]
MSAISHDQGAREQTMFLVGKEQKESLPQDLVQLIISKLEGGSFWITGNTCRTFRRCQLRVMMERGEQVLKICLNVFPAWKLPEVKAVADEGYSHQGVFRYLADQRRAIVDGARGELSRASETRGQVLGVVNMMRQTSEGVDRLAFSRKDELEVVRAAMIHMIKQQSPSKQLFCFKEIFCVLIAKGKIEELNLLFESLAAGQKETLRAYPRIAEALVRGGYEESVPVIGAEVCQVLERVGANGEEAYPAAMEEVDLLMRIPFNWCGETGNFHHITETFGSQGERGVEVFQPASNPNFFPLFTGLFSLGMCRRYFEFLSKLDIAADSMRGLVQATNQTAIEMTFDLAETARLLEEFKEIFDGPLHGQIKGLVCAEMIKRKEYDQAFKLIDHMEGQEHKNHFLDGLFANYLLPIEEFRPFHLDEKVFERLVRMFENWQGQATEGMLNMGHGHILTQAGKFDEAAPILERVKRKAHSQYTSMGHVVNGELQRALEVASSQTNQEVKICNYSAIANQCLFMRNWDELEVTLHHLKEAFSEHITQMMKLRLALECVKRGQVDFSERLMEGAVQTEANKTLFCLIMLACHQKGEYPYLFRIIEQHGIPDSVKTLFHTLF